MTASDGTLLFLHAHPDDECILTGVTMAKAARVGLRVLVAYATRGDAGETNRDLGTQTLGERRTEEAHAACRELGVDRIEWLGYQDSGMVDTDTTRHPEAFCNVALDEVSARLADVFGDEQITAIVGYDANGTYGHPDHVQIHHAAHHAATAVGASWVLEATYDREYLATLDDASGYGDIDETFASARASLTHFCEGRDPFLTKAKAISHHRSQVPDDWDEQAPDLAGFARRFGTEWYISHRVARDASWAPLDRVLAPQHEWSGAPPTVD